jgi:uncharacterized protein YjaG (DUF416 family)
MDQRRKVVGQCQPICKDQLAQQEIPEKVETMAKQLHLHLHNQVHREHKVQLVLRVRQVPLVHLDRQVLRVLQEKMVHQDLQVPPEVQGEVDLQVQLVQRVLQEQQEHKVPLVPRK